MDSKKSHRDRKNGASHEQWEKQKAERNAKQREAKRLYVRAALAQGGSNGR